MKRQYSFLLMFIIAVTLTMTSCNLIELMTTPPPNATDNQVSRARAPTSITPPPASANDTLIELKELSPGRWLIVSGERQDISRINVAAINYGSKTGNNPLKTSSFIGKSVTGAEIQVQLAMSSASITRCATDKMGEFSFDVRSFAQSTGISDVYKVNLIIKSLPTFSLIEDATNEITVEIRKTDKPIHIYILWWLTASPAQNKGTFAVSGKSDA